MQLKDLAQVLGCTIDEADAICVSGQLHAIQTHGGWTVSKRELIRQLLVLRSPALAS